MFRLITLSGVPTTQKEDNILKFILEKEKDNEKNHGNYLNSGINTLHSGV